ncbi:unnamed protein product, partial [Rhizoctonia solani]
MSFPPTSASDEDTISQLTEIGIHHIRRFERLGEVDDVDKAVEYMSIALALTPDDHSTLPTLLMILGKCYSDRFQRLSELSDIRRAIECETRALSLTPDDHPDMPARLVSVGLSHCIRYQRVQELEDLNQGREYMSIALTLTPQDHPELAYRLTSLGALHGERFKALGELADLQKAIECHSRAVALTPTDHPHFPHRLTSLGISHGDRFQRLGELADLQKAIECFSRAVALTPTDHPDFPHRLTSLGVSHSDRFKRLGELADLDNAIQSMSHALTLTSDDHPHMPNYLRNIALAFKNRFTHSHRLHDIQTATTYASCSVALTHHGHSALPDLYHYLAKFQFFQSRATDDLPLMQHSLYSYRSACQVAIGSPRVRFAAALEWASLASTCHLLQPMEAYQSTIDLLPQFIWLGATTSQRYHDLNKAKNLAVQAASAAIHCSEYMLAIEWLEHARCVVWNQSLMLRSPLDQLQASYPDLAVRLHTVANRLHDAGTQSRESLQESSGESVTEQAAQQHRQLAQEYDDLLSKARQLPGFENFLKPTKADGLIRAARYGPIVVINCDTDRSDALLIQPGHDQVTHIPLPGFTLDKAQRVRRRLDLAVRGKQPMERGDRRPVIHQESQDDFGSMLATLWYDIVKPVLDYLGYTTNISTCSLPHVTWCPTGVLSFLPLHAAGDYDRPASRVFDYVVSSYTPTLTALLTSTKWYLRRDCRVLTVAQGATPGHTPLPGTIQELTHVHQ